MQDYKISERRHRNNVCDLGFDYEFLDTILGFDP